MPQVKVGPLDSALPLYRKALYDDLFTVDRTESSLTQKEGMSSRHVY